MYYWLPIVFPGSASVTVKVTRRLKGVVTKVVVSCSGSGLAAAQCLKTSMKSVRQLTVLICSVEAIGVGRFDCMNAS